MRKIVNATILTLSLIYLLEVMFLDKKISFSLILATSVLIIYKFFTHDR